MSKCRVFQLTAVLVTMACPNLARASHITDGLFNASVLSTTDSTEWGAPPPYLGSKNFFSPNAFLYADQSAGVLYLMYDCITCTNLGASSFFDVYFEVLPDNT